MDIQSSITSTVPSSKQTQIQQKLLQLKLKRINELNNNLKTLLNKDRIYASNASYLIINYISNAKDYTIPEVWGHMDPDENPFRNNQLLKSKKNFKQGGNNDHPGGCCVIL
ncbi:hypothetical protein WICMUC_005597 [Wickerhamomyces mucosus]|uniref:Guanine nucleotide-binding protein subunit gamma n=1 Tax=Wickerhamomyces mucosus TaxID=1378264 RepID=A0A9P8P6S0_9ASCO|nr:hypothetical protein WICMUC_005597 [Wickerhamomyces mucosus]